MAPTIVLIVQTALRRYAVRHDDLLETRLLSAAELQPNGASEQAYLDVELGALFDPADHVEMARWCAMIVPMRRRYIAFRVCSITTFLEQPVIVPLPQLVHTQLTQPWSTGVILLDDEPVVQLDLRALARSVLAGQAPARNSQPRSAFSG